MTSISKTLIAFSAVGLIAATALSSPVSASGNYHVDHVGNQTTGVSINDTANDVALNSNTPSHRIKNGQ